MVIPAEAAAHAVGGVGDAAAGAVPGEEALGFAANSAAADLGGEAVAARAAQEAVQDIGRDAAAAAAGNQVLAGSARDAAGASAVQAAAVQATGDAAAATAKDQYLLAMAQRMQANTARDAAASGLASAAGASAAGTAAGAATGWWARWGNVIHWVIAGGAEFLAVFIPATVAAGGAAAVMAQGVGDLYEHLMAMYDAQEATANIFGETTGEMVGMKDVLQAAQNAADPRIFELLGAGINIAKADSGQFVQEGTQVLNVLDQFAAKITGELTGAVGGQLHTLMADGTRDLAGLGAVLGNTGHAVINLAADMPGLAEVLLSVLDGATRLLSVLSGMPGILITIAMGFEEFGRWGSLASSVLGKLTGASVESTGAWYSLWGNALIVSQNFVRAAMTGFANVASGLSSLLMSGGAFAAQWGAKMMAAGAAEDVMGAEGVVAAGETTVLEDALFTAGATAMVTAGEMAGLGAALAVFAAEVQAAIAVVTPFGAFLIVLAAVGFGILIDKAETATTAIEKWSQAMNAALRSTSDLELIPKIASDIANADVQMAQAQQQFTQAANASGSAASDVASRLNGTSGAAYGAALNIHDLADESHYLDNAMQTVLEGAGMLADTYKTSFIGALALAQGAGVNLTQSLKGNSQAAADARIQIANYVAGMNAMGESSTAVGHDVTLLGISSALSATKVQQLNQAIDQFVSGLTGGTADLGALSESILNIGQVTGTTANYLGTDAASINLSVGQVAQSLTSFGQIGAQTWQNFDNALSGSAEQLADWWRTAATEGAAGAPQFTQAMQDIVSEFVPFAAKSGAAQQELVGFAQAQGLNVQTFPQLVSQLKQAGASSGNLATLTQEATGKMADMNQIAQALGSSIGTDVVGAMNNARLAASGLTGAAQDLAGAWGNEHEIDSQVITGFEQTVGALYKVYGNTGLAEQAADAYASSLGLTQTQVNQLNNDIAGYVSSLSKVPRSVNTTVTTNYVVTGNPTLANPSGIQVIDPGHYGHAAGAAYVPPGWAAVGEAGPELIKFAGGESVTPNWQAGPRGGGGGSPAVIHTHVYIDGHEVFTAVQDQTYEYNRRNGLTTTGSLAPPG
jgi:hypothetical protein